MPMPRSSSSVAELDDPLLALVGGDQLRELRPRGHKRSPPRRVRLDLGRRAQRDRDARAHGPHRPDRGRARLGLEGLPAAAVVRVEVKDPRAGVHRGPRLGGELVRGARHRRMLAIAVERCLKERHARSVRGRRGRGASARPLPTSSAHQLGRRASSRPCSRASDSRSGMPARGRWRRASSSRRARGRGGRASGSRGRRRRTRGTGEASATRGIVSSSRWRLSIIGSVRR